MFALGLLSWLYDRPTEGTLAFLEAKFGNRAGDHGGQHRGLPARAGTSARRPRRSRSGTRSSRPRLSAGHVPQHHRQHRAGLRAHRRRRSWPGCRCSSARTRSRRPPTSCTSWPSTSSSASARSRPRTRSPASARRSARRSAASLGVTTTSGPGMALKAETIGLARVAGAAADHRATSSAAGPSTGHADQDRAGRPAAGAVRPQRRVARCPSSPRASPADCFARRDRGGPDRDQVPHPGHPAVRRLPGQRLRALAHPGRRHAARPERRSSRSPPRTTAGRRRRPSSSRSGGTRRRWPGRGPSRARRAWSTASAASRRPTCTGDISYDPDNHDLMVRLRQAKIDGIAADIPPLEVDDPDGDARVLVLGWGSTYGSIGAAVRRIAQRPAQPVAQAHLRHLNPFPRQPRRGAAPLRQGARPGDQPRPARAAAARPLPGRRDLLQPGPRPAVPAQPSWPSVIEEVISHA